MGATGLVNNIITATASIDSGRKGFAIIGKERERRISYEEGIAEAMTAFKEAQATADPQTIILVEYTFLSQELQFCENPIKTPSTALQKRYKVLMMHFARSRLSRIQIIRLLMMSFPLSANTV